MGGGASSNAGGKPIEPWNDESITVKHRKPFHVFIKLRCDSFSNKSRAYRKIVAGRRRLKIVFRLRGDVCPYTCENFRRLCCSEGKLGAGFLGSFVHQYEQFGEMRLGRIGAQLQEKTITLKEKMNEDKKEGVDAATEITVKYLPTTAGVSQSAFGANFDDENFELDHKRGSVSTRAAGKGGHGSEFFINLAEENEYATQQKNGEDVCFGQIVEGIEVLDMIGDLMGSAEWDTLRSQMLLAGVDAAARPADPISVAKCGELENFLPSTPKQKRRRVRSRGRKRSGRKNNNLSTRSTKRGSSARAQSIQEDGEWGMDDDDNSENSGSLNSGSLTSNSRDDDSVVSMVQSELPSVVESCQF